MIFSLGSTANHQNTFQPGINFFENESNELDSEVVCQNCGCKIIGLGASVGTYSYCSRGCASKYLAPYGLIFSK